MPQPWATVLQRSISRVRGIRGSEGNWQVDWIKLNAALFADPELLRQTVAEAVERLWYRPEAADRPGEFVQAHLDGHSRDIVRNLRPGDEAPERLGTAWVRARLRGWTDLDFDSWLARRLPGNSLTSQRQSGSTPMANWLTPPSPSPTRTPTWSSTATGSRHHVLPRRGRPGVEHR